MILGVVLSIIIIGIWLYIGALSYSFYSVGKYNRFMFKNIYVSAVLSIFQSILGIYFIITLDSSLQPIRWMCFSLMELNFMYLVLRAFKNRHTELIIMALFNILVLISSLSYSLFLNCSIATTLSVLAYISGVAILRKYFTWIFLLYGMTSIIPVIFEFTSVESLLAGIIFSIGFLYGTVKLYTKEKVDFELKEMIKKQ